jgi:hypothetical protein
MKTVKKPVKVLVPKQADRAKVLGNIIVSERGTADCTCYTSCTRC